MLRPTPRSLVAVLVPSVAMAAFLLLPRDAGQQAWQGEALATLHRFQDALRRGQHDAAREMVATASRPYVDELPAPKTSGDLLLLAAKRDQARVELRVREPEAGGTAAEGTFVVVRERGRWVVDLIETAGANRREIPLPGPARRLVPAPAGPGDVETARRALAREAAWNRRRS